MPVEGGILHETDEKGCPLTMILSVSEGTTEDAIALAFNVAVMTRHSSFNNSLTP